MFGAQFATQILCNYNCPLFLLQFNLGAKSYARSANITLNPTTPVQFMISSIALAKPSVMNSRRIDFTPLLLPRFEYATQKEINQTRVDMLAACTIHYNLNFGLIVRFLSGEYTAEHRSLADLEAAVDPHIPEDDMAHIRRIFQKRFPSTLDNEVPHVKKIRMIKRGNQPSVDNNMESVRESTNKEERNSHVVAFPEWQCHFSPFANHVSQGMVFKDKKDPRWYGMPQQNLSQTR